MQTIIRLETSLGAIDIELDLDRAPRTAAHFASLARTGMLADSLFYRVVHATGNPDEPPTIDVVQGGVGWDKADACPSVEHETTLATGLLHLDGAVSLARGAGAGGGSEFFICVGDQPALDATQETVEGEGGFAVFGRVSTGMDVVRKIHGLPAEGEPPGGDEKFRGQFLTDYLVIDSIGLQED